MDEDSIASVSDQALPSVMGVKFGFTAKAGGRPKKIETSILSEEKPVDDEEEKEVIKGIEDRQIEGTKPVQKKELLVIPMIASNVWHGDRTKLKQNHAAKTEHRGDTSVNLKGGIDLYEGTKRDLYLAAKQALLDESSNNGDSDEKKTSTRVVPLLLQNMVPTGYEDDDRLDVSLRPDESQDADYAQVPIDDFGVAMLRGMGWKEGDPIGKTNKQNVIAKIPELRPKGLGLGANRSLAAQLKKGTGGGNIVTKEDKPKSDEQTIKIGGFIKIVGGVHRDAYGKIESLDEDNCRLMVRLALGSAIVTVSQYAVEVVSAKEYERDGKCINKAKYERYKQEQSTTANGGGENGSVSRDDPLNVDEIDLTDSDRRTKKSKRKNRSRSPSTPKKKSKKHRTESPDDTVPWVRADLKVRIIDKQFKNGRYYKEKVRVVDVAGLEECTCSTAGGQTLEGLSQNQLETVIPKTFDTDAHVMIVLGKWRGEVGRIVSRDSKRSEASVQLIRHDDRITTCSYDAMSQFDGDLSLYVD